METKFGKALYAILCAASPRLAHDAALKPLVIGLTRKQCDLRSLEPKLLAMDADLRKSETLAAMQAAKDASEEEETEEEKRGREEKEAKDRKKAKDHKTAKDKSFEEWAQEEEDEPEHEDGAEDRRKARDAEEDEEDRAKRREYEKKAQDAKSMCEDDFNGLVEKLEKKGYSKEYATKVAGKVAKEKGDEGGRDKAKDRKAKDEEEKEKKAGDAKMKHAMDEFKRELREAEEARRAVRPVVGDVLAYDSAGEIYAFALDHMKVDHSDVSDVPALRALFNTAQKATRPAPRMAFDSTGVEDKFPNATRQIQVM